MSPFRESSIGEDLQLLRLLVSALGEIQDEDTLAGKAGMAFEHAFQRVVRLGVDGRRERYRTADDAGNEVVGCLPANGEIAASRMAPSLAVPRKELVVLEVEAPARSVKTKPR